MPHLHVCHGLSFLTSLACRRDPDIQLELIRQPCTPISALRSLPAPSYTTEVIPRHRPPTPVTTLSASLHLREASHLHPQVSLCHPISSRRQVFCSYESLPAAGLSPARLPPTPALAPAGFLLLLHCLEPHNHHCSSLQLCTDNSNVTASPARNHPRATDTYAQATLPSRSHCFPSCLGYKKPEKAHWWGLASRKVGHGG